jgi:hypothetical protein
MTGRLTIIRPRSSLPETFGVLSDGLPTIIGIQRAGDPEDLLNSSAWQAQALSQTCNEVYITFHCI